jgi:hypothetical protein
MAIKLAACIIAAMKSCGPGTECVISVVNT